MNGVLIDGKWSDGQGAPLEAHDPETGETVWAGTMANKSDVDAACQAARRAFTDWALKPFEARQDILERYRDLVKADAEELATMIARQNGKPLWEARTEAAAVSGKVDISIKAYHERTGSRSNDMAGGQAVLRHKPHGVMAVLGPFNFPAHLSNGHIVPALLAGNTVVVKPSELTPGPLAFLMERMIAAGVPDGIINLVQGAREVGEALTQHPHVDGILFTGGVKAGHAIHRQCAGQPEKILALELGGNNPLIWWDSEDLEAAAFAVIQSSFLTAGQRCTCARRLFVPQGPQGDEAIEALIAMTRRIRVGGAFEDPQPFMGPLIRPHAAAAMADAFSTRANAGGRVLLAMERPDPEGAFITPGIIDMSGADRFPDEEHFGPMLQIWRVASFDAAIAGANDTQFGLSAGLFSQDVEKWQRFLALSRAGIVNWNRQTTGASGAAPFGGIGQSGNHRPSAYYAADYCAYPVASVEGAALPAMNDQHPGIA